MQVRNAFLLIRLIEESIVQTTKSGDTVESGPVCNHEQYNVVYKAKLDGVRM